MYLVNLNSLWQGTPKMIPIDVIFNCYLGGSSCWKYFCMTVSPCSYLFSGSRGRLPQLKRISICSRKWKVTERITVYNLSWYISFSWLNLNDVLGKDHYCTYWKIKGSLKTILTPKSAENDQPILLYLLAAKGSKRNLPRWNFIAEWVRSTPI